MDIVQLILLSGRVDVNTVDEYGSSLLLKLLGRKIMDDMF